MRLLHSPAAVAILLGGFYFALGMGVPQYRDFQPDSDHLLAGSAARAAADGSGVWSLGGFMNAYEGGWNTPDPSPYCSQLCLHYKVYAWVSGFFPQHTNRVYVAFRLLAALYRHRCLLRHEVQQTQIILPKSCRVMIVLQCDHANRATAEHQRRTQSLSRRTIQPMVGASSA